jgi:sulfate/thiosulfate transport system substrate-binding protein
MKLDMNQPRSAQPASPCAPCPTQRRKRGLILITSLIGLLSSCGSAPPQDEITLVSFSTSQAAYEAIIPKFAADWKAKTGRSVTVSRSFGPSGAQARAVADGLPADVVSLPLALDIQRLETVGLIDKGWEKDWPNQSIVARSVPVIVSRPGNPKPLRQWSDLGQDKLRIITTNPKSSGIARWTFLGLWGSMSRTGSSEAQTREFSRRVYGNVPVFSRDAREATDAFFRQGQGDVLINYEQEVLLAKAKGEALTYSIPSPNISIEIPVAIVDKNVIANRSTLVATAFVAYLFGPEAQREFAKAGFRPTDAAIAREFAPQYPAVPELFTVQDLGGWKKAQKTFFADKGIFYQIEAELRR